MLMRKTATVKGASLPGIYSEKTEKPQFLRHASHLQVHTCWHLFFILEVLAHRIAQISALLALLAFIDKRQ